MKGSRINAVIRELRGEKIDIISFSSEITEYAVNALNPARISKVLISDPVNKVLEVIVPADQLSLAIGRKGQNVRLASKLLGWEIDIKSDEEKKLEVLGQMGEMEQAQERAALEGMPLAEVEGIGAAMLERLAEAGIGTVGELAARSTEELTEVPGIGEKTADKLKALAEGALAVGEAGSEAESGDETLEGVETDSGDDE